MARFVAVRRMRVGQAKQSKGELLPDERYALAQLDVAYGFEARRAGK